MILALTSLQFSNAQICQPGSQTVAGIYPDSATGMPCAIVGTLYSEVMTAVLPVDTTTEFPAGSGIMVDFWLDSVVLLGIANLPPGIVMAGCNPVSCVFPGGSSGCVLLTGTPTIAGTYDMEVYLMTYIEDKIFGAKFNQEDTIFYYSINVVASDLAVDTNSITNVSVCGGSDGAIDLIVTGGTGSYYYIWDDPNSTTTEDPSGLAAGIYNVSVTDFDSCFTKTLSVTVSGPGDISVDTSGVIPVSVYGGSDGSIDVTVTGGTPSYTYSWTGPGSFTSALKDITGLEAGTYILNVTDANGCVSSISVTISQPSGVSVLNSYSFKVSQNVPNPFTGKTKITFTLPNDRAVGFKVYNILGTVIYTENIQGTRGVNMIEFSSKGINPGIYMYNLGNDTNKITKRMIITTD